MWSLVEFTTTPTIYSELITCIGNIVAGNIGFTFKQPRESCPHQVCFGSPKTQADGLFNFLLLKWHVLNLLTKKLLWIYQTKKENVVKFIKKKKERNCCEIRRTGQASRCLWEIDSCLRLVICGVALSILKTHHLGKRVWAIEDLDGKPKICQVIQSQTHVNWYIFRCKGSWVVSVPTPALPATELHGWLNRAWPRTSSRRTVVWFKINYDRPACVCQSRENTYLFCPIYFF